MTSTHLAMDYREIDTAAEILAAFKGCANAGEEIQLFESLAEREQPPVGEFVTILKEIKLETALALAIQAFGKIKDDEIKAGLKGSSDLLALLCEQAKSGSTDLIRWSAATTIEKIGFDFIAVSRHLTEEPEVIIQRIVQSKVKVLTDAERNRHGIKENNDYDSFIRFWVYGATYELRSATVNSGGGNAAVVVNAVVKAQDVWGIKQTNSLFQVLESKTPLEYNKKKVYENKLFEQDSQSLSSDLLKRNQNSTDSQVLVANQIHCLQSDTASLRKKAAMVLLSIDSAILSIFKQQNNALEPIIDIFNKDYFGSPDSFCYKEVIKYINFLEIANQYLSRDDACKYCQQIHSRLLNFIENRKKEIDVAERNILFSMQLTQDTLHEIELIFPHTYEKYHGIDFGIIPKVDVEDDNWQITLNQYHKKIRLNAEELNEEIALEEKERKIIIQRENRIAEKFKAIDSSKKYIVDTLNVAKMLYPEVYDNYCNFDFGELPEVNTENDQWHVILKNYHEKITTIRTKLDKSIKESRLKQEQLKKEEKIQEELDRNNRREQESRKQEEAREEEIIQGERLEKEKLRIRNDKRKQAKLQDRAIKITFGFILVSGIFLIGYSSYNTYQAQEQANKTYFASLSDNEILGEIDRLRQEIDNHPYDYSGTRYLSHRVAAKENLSKYVNRMPKERLNSLKRSGQLTWN